MNTKIVRSSLSEEQLYQRDLMGKHVDRPVAGTVVAAWHFADGTRLAIRPDEMVEKAKTVSGLSRFQKGQWS